MTTGRGHSIFCDDIREEVGGKMSYMGCYSGDMIVEGQFPLTLPKLGIAIIFRLDVEDSGQAVALRIYLPGQGDAFAFETVINVPDFEIDALVERPIDTDPGEQPQRGLVVNALLSPAEILEPGFIRVRALIHDKVHKLGALRVVKAPTAG